MKKAFTMLELIFVIVVAGILAAMIIPSTRTNPLQEAAIQVLSHIRYTQHLAMVDDKYDASNLDSAGDPKWYKERWQIIFSSNTNSGSEMGYTIFTDTSGDSTGHPNEAEIALNPSNSNQRMTGGYTGDINLDIDNAAYVGVDKLNIGRKYSIDSVVFSNSCDGSNGASKRISFDHLGRPLQGDISATNSAYESNYLITASCVITLTHSSGDDLNITIEPETGYAKIDF